MKKILIAFVLLIVFGACTKNFEKLNTDPTQFTKVSPEALMETVIKRTGEMVGSNGLNDGINVNMWQIANLVEPGARYAANDQNIWRNSYVGILENLVQLNGLYGSDTAFANRVQIAKIWQAYIYSILVGYFGPIPVDQANNPDYLNTIKFQDEDTVYTKILTMLKTASDKIDVNKTKDKLTYDVLYGNGANQLLNWKKFANTLRLRIALRCRRNLTALAETHIREVMGNESLLIANETETAKVIFENVNNNENPYYRVFTKNPYTLTFPKLPEMLFTYFRTYKDPRIDYYFDSVKSVANRYILTDTLTSTGDDSLRIVTYPIPHYGLVKSSTKLPGWTAIAGQTDPMAQNVNVFSNLASAIVTNPARPIIVLSYAEAQFLKAEAAQLGLGGAQSPQTYYNMGIDANFAFWGISASVRDAYKNVDGVKWGTTPVNTFKNYINICGTDLPAGDIYKIYFQSYLNCFPDQPFDAWCLQRQTRVLQLSPHTNPGFSGLIFQDVPDRGQYTPSILAQNPGGYQSALDLLGINNTNIETTNPYVKLKFEVPYTIPDWNARPAAYNYAYIQKWYGTTIQQLNAAAAAGGFTNLVKITKTYK